MATTNSCTVERDMPCTNNQLKHITDELARRYLDRQTSREMTGMTIGLFQRQNTLNPVHRTYSSIILLRSDAERHI